MPDDSIIHRALVLGAIALAWLGGPAMSFPLVPEPTTSQTTAVVVQEEKRWPQVFSGFIASDTDETPGGPVPAQDYRVRIDGINFSKAFDVSIPNHIAGASYMVGSPAIPDAGHTQGMAISYQATAGAPRFVMQASLQDLQSKLDGLLKDPVDLTGMQVTGIHITPLPTLDPRPAVTFKPAPEPEPKKNEGNIVFEIPIDVPKVLEMIASILTIASVVAEQVKRRRESQDRESAEVASREYRVVQNAVTWTSDDGAAQSVVTAGDIEKSDTSERRLIDTLSASVNKLFNIWMNVYPQRKTSPDPVVNAQVESKLDELQNSFCTDLTKLKAFIERTGGQLEGFEAVRAVCEGGL